MNSFLVLIALFTVGIFQDALSALYLRLVTERRIFLAAILSVVITIVGFSAWAALAESLMTGGLHNLAAYAVGGGVGTWIGLYKKNPAG